MTYHEERVLRCQKDATSGSAGHRGDDELLFVVILLSVDKESEGGAHPQASLCVTGCTPWMRDAGGQRVYGLLAWVIGCQTPSTANDEQAVGSGHKLVTVVRQLQAPHAAVPPYPDHVAIGSHVHMALHTGSARGVEVIRIVVNHFAVHQ